MDFVTFWLPIIGGILLGGLALSAWYGGNKTLAIWSGFAGLVCLLLLAALQVQEAVWDSARDPDSTQPYLFIVTASIAGFGRAEPIQTSVDIKNVSDSINAIVTSSVVIITTRPYPLVDPLPIRPLVPGRIVIPPGVTQPLRAAMARALTAEENAAVLASQRAIYVFGEVHYRSPKGQEHITAFRLICLGDQTRMGTLRATEEGNYEN